MYTLICAGIVGDSGKVYAFEPDPVNYSLLCKNIEENGYNNVVAINKAVSNENGILNLYLSDENTADHRIYDLDDERESIEVESVTLDSFFGGYDGKIDFIKIDIEGSEPRALAGMKELIKTQDKLSIISEFWPSSIIKSGWDPEEYLDFLIDEGFEITESKNYDSGRSSSKEEIMKSLSDKGAFTNLFCKK